MGLILLFGFHEEAVYLSPAPLYHAAPLRFVLITIRSGGTAIIMERFDALQCLELIEKYRVTHSQWVPTMFVRMLRFPERKGPDMIFLLIKSPFMPPLPFRSRSKSR